MKVIEYISKGSFLLHPFWVLLFSLMSLSAQSFSYLDSPVTTLYPVRIDHKWGFCVYIDGAFRLEIPAKYDLISPEYEPWNRLDSAGLRSPYRLFEINAQIGLMDRAFNEILPARFRRIRPLSDRYFAVESQSLFKLAIVFGRDSIKYWDKGRYDDILYLESTNDAGIEYFLVKSNDKWGVCNLDGQEIVPPKYVELQPAHFPDFFMARRDTVKKWGLLAPSGELILDYQYDSIYVLDKDTYAALPVDRDETQDNQWEVYIKKPVKSGILSPEGFLPIPTLKTGRPEPILTDQWQSFKKLTDQLVAFEKLDRVRIKNAKYPAYIATEGFLPGPIPLVDREARALVDKTRYQIDFDSPEWRRIARAGKFEKVTRLYHLGSDSTLQIVGAEGGLDRLDDQHFVIKTATGKLGVWNNKLREVLPPKNWERIQASGIPFVFFVQQGGKWGIIRNKDGQGSEVECQFDAIEPFRHGIARCQQTPDGARVGSAKYGAISHKADSFFILHCKFDELDIQQDRVTTFNYGERLDRDWMVDPKGRFVEPKVYEDVSIDEFQQAELNYREAKHSPLVPSQQKKPYQIQSADPTAIFLKRKKEGLQMVRSKTSPYDSMLFVTTLDFQAPIMGLYHYSNPIRNSFTEAFNNIESQRSLSQLTLYHTEQDQPLNREPYLGFRRFAAFHPYTAFIDASGQMGLVDGQGQEKSMANGEALRYTYIGPFINGFAKVCRGGKLSRLLNSDLRVCDRRKLELGSWQNFFDDFNLRIPDKQQRNLSNFEDGVYVLPDGNELPKWGFIDKDGNEVVPPGYDFLSDYSDDGLAYILKFRDASAWDAGQGCEGKKPDDFLYGVTNNTGIIVMEPIYVNIHRYKNYFVVQTDATPVFYYNDRGQLVLVNKNRPFPYYDDRSRYRNENDRFGFIDPFGNQVIPPQYIQARDFSNGLAMVVTPSGAVQFLQASGAVQFSVDLSSKNLSDKLGNFAEGLCLIKKRGKWGYIDLSGQLAIPNQFDGATPFAGGVATVYKKENDKRLSGVIDRSGKLIVPFGTFSLIEAFNKNAYAKFKDSEGNWGIIDASGQSVLPARYHDIEIDDVASGFVRVAYAKDKWGLANLQGQDVIAPEYYRLGEIAEGMIVIRKNRYSSVWELYDLQQKRWIDGTFHLPVFDGQSQPIIFQSGVALVREDHKNKIITRRGKRIDLGETTPLFYREGFFGMRGKDRRYFYADRYGQNLFIRDFDKISPHYLGIARIKRYDKYQVINRRGIDVIPPKYGRVYVNPYGFVKANPNRFFGLVDLKGKILIPPQYDHLAYCLDGTNRFLGIFRIELGDQIGYVKINQGTSNLVWTLKR